MKIAFMKRAVVAGGFLFLCAAPRLALAQSGRPATGLRQPVRSNPAQRRTYVSPSEFLAGLTLTDDQIAKIDQIREDTRTRLAAVTKDEKLGVEAKDAFLQGLQRIENGKIFEVLTPEQQVDVRKRMATLRAAAQPRPRQLQPPPAPESTPQPK